VIFQLIYTCALTANTGCEELRVIAENSRKHNLEVGITGILLFQDGSVLQVLEGERKIVQDLYDRITRDTRVTNPLILIQRMATKREFPNWSMGFRNAASEDFAFNLTGNSLTKIFSKDVSSEINTIGRTFARVNGLA